MRVAINAQLHPGGHFGGVEQFVIGLVHGLGKLEDGREEYIIVAQEQNSDWLTPYLGRNQRVVIPPPTRSDLAKRFLGPMRSAAGRFWRKARRAITGTSRPTLQSTGFYESLGVDLVHFPFQIFSYCNLPIIYNPHDLQHLHYPEFFASEDIAARESSWPTACRLAKAVVTDAYWVREDVSRRYGIELGKIYSIPMGPPTAAYGQTSPEILEAVKRDFDLPETFALYPAQTWRHKNHLRLIEAIARLRDREGTVVNLVCSGQENVFGVTIRQRIRELGIESLVHFVGFVEPTELRALYRLAQFVVHPSLFEGGGLPVLEAFHEGVALTCSNTTSLPEYAGNAALYFDPTSVNSIANALRQMALDDQLRRMLQERGSERVKLFTWERTAKAYRALYRQVAQCALTEEDRQILSGGFGTVAGMD